MNEILKDSILFGVSVSLLGYEAGRWMQKRYKKAIFNPLLISVVLVISFLLLFHIDYETYNNGAKYIGFLLTPATVCLAIPLYEQLELLKNNVCAVALGILSGVITSLTGVWILSRLFSFSHEEYVTLLPKSITTGIGIGISEEMGGIPTITVAVIVITGILGNVLAESICKLFRITEPVAKGLAIGTSAHAMGTSKAIEMGDIEGAMSSLAIASAGLVTVIFASIYANFI